MKMSCASSSQSANGSARAAGGSIRARRQIRHRARRYRRWDRFGRGQAGRTESGRNRPDNQPTPPRVATCTGRASPVLAGTGSKGVPIRGAGGAFGTMATLPKPASNTGPGTTVLYKRRHGFGRCRCRSREAGRSAPARRPPNPRRHGASRVAARPPGPAGPRRPGPIRLARPVGRGVPAARRGAITGASPPRSDKTLRRPVAVEGGERPPDGLRGALQDRLGQRIGPFAAASTATGARAAKIGRARADGPGLDVLHALAQAARQRVNQRTGGVLPTVAAAQVEAHRLQPDPGAAAVVADRKSPAVDRRRGAVGIEPLPGHAGADGHHRSRPAARAPTRAA